MCKAQLVNWYLELDEQQPVPLMLQERRWGVQAHCWDMCRYRPVGLGLGVWHKPPFGM